MREHADAARPGAATATNDQGKRHPKPTDLSAPPQARPVQLVLPGWWLTNVHCGCLGGAR